MECEYKMVNFILEVPTFTGGRDTNLGDKIQHAIEQLQMFIELLKPGETYISSYKWEWVQHRV